MSRGVARERGSGASPRGGVVRRVWDQVGTLLLAVLLALAIRTFVIEPYRIPSGSMLPTLLIGDHLFVNKFIYGIRIPFTDWRLPGLREPRRGDVVVFNVARRGSRIFPADRRPHLPHDRFVKRIVGLPGDTVEVRNGRLYVNGNAVAMSDTRGVFPDEAGRRLTARRERLGACEHWVLDDPRRPGPGRRPVGVEDDRYFVMGDNRDYSNDSRNWGTVRLVDLKGPAFVLYWSWDWNGPWLALLNPLTWWDNLAHRVRWGRVGERLDCLGADAALPPPEG